MKKLFTMVAETSSGKILQQRNVLARTQKEAQEDFWSELTDEQKNATASVECIDEQFADIEVQRANIHRTFKYDKVYTAMKALNWSWYDTNRQTPSVNQMISAVDRLLDSAREVMIDHPTWPVVFAESGGFSVCARRYDNGAIEYTARFVVEDAAGWRGM